MQGNLLWDPVALSNKNHKRHFFSGWKGTMYNESGRLPSPNIYTITSTRALSDANLQMHVYGHFLFSSKWLQRICALFCFLTNKDYLTSFGFSFKKTSFVILCVTRGDISCCLWTLYSELYHFQWKDKVTAMWAQVSFYQNINILLVLIKYKKTLCTHKLKTPIWLNPPPLHTQLPSLQGLGSTVTFTNPPVFSVTTFPL